VRNVLEGSVSFALRDATGAAIVTGRLVDATTWSTGGTAAGAAAAELDAQRRLVRILADRTAAALIAADPESAP
jgi:LPS-assembly lipoprotein